MAARYWILGAGNWNDPLHWSATSGGVGGASVPTMNDDVYFDSNSGTGTVTVNAIANMRNCTFAQTQLITLTNAAYTFNIYGNWTLCSNTYLNTSFTGTGYVYLKATTSVNITSNGCTRAWNRLYFDGVGGTWTNQDDFDINPSTPYLKNGHWNTNSKYINTMGLSIDTGIKMLTLGNSIFNGNTGHMYFHFNSAGMTLNAGTSTIINNNIHSGAGFYGGPFTFYNVIVSVYTQSASSKDSIFNNLTVNYSLIGGHPGITSEGGTIIINNNFTINDYSTSTRRLLIYSSIIGTPQIIICNGTITASNVDFRDIVGAGTANWDLSAIEGGSGDCGGNSGITFTPAQTQYFKHTLGAVNWSDVTKWFSNYERTIAGRVPLPQDDAIFDENSFTGASALNINVSRIGGINMQLVTQSVAVNLSVNVNCHRSWILGETINPTGSALTLMGIGQHILNTYSKSYGTIELRNSGEYTLMSNLIVSYAFVQTMGTIKFNNYNYTGRFIQLNGGVAYLGNGLFTLITNLNEFATYLNSVIYAEGSTLKLVAASGNSIITFASPGNVFNRVWFSGLHTGHYIITGSNTFNEIIIDSGRKVRFTNGTTQTINKLTAIGTPEQPITIGSTTAGQRHTINYTGSEASTVEYCKISDSKVTQARRLLAKNSVNAGNNQNWGFEELPPLALNFGQVDKMYVGGSEVVSAYYGEMKIK